MQKQKQIMKEREGHNDSDIWGYVVCLGTIITFIAGIGHVNSFGLIYNDFIRDTHASSKSLTTSHGVFAVMLAIGGILLNFQKKRFSLRTGGLIGAMIFTTGSVTTIFISNTNQLPFTFGLLQGVGFGMMVPVCYATLNYYFIKKRTTAMSICKAVQGITQIFYPQFVKQALSLYGFRGTLLLICGFSLHSVPGMIIMRNWDPEKRTASIIIIQSVVVLVGPNVCYNQNAKGEKEDRLLSLDIEGENKESSINEIHRNNKTKLKIFDILDVQVLSDPVYCNICIGQSFVNFSDLTFFILQPMLLFQYGFEQYEVASCISIGACADVVGRCVLAVLSSLTPLNRIDTRWLFYTATLFTLFMRIVFLQMRQFLWVSALTGALGLLRAILHVSSPLVIADYVTTEDFPGAYALSMLAAGLVNVACAPLIGLLTDFYQDYVPAFYTLTLCCVPCLLLWPVEYYALRTINKVEHL